MPITPVPPSSVDPVAQVVVALEAATTTLADATLTLVAADATIAPAVTAGSLYLAANYR